MCSVPERTCVGCRQATAGEALERFVYIEGQGIIFDLRRKAPGRGVYVHPRIDCITQAVKRKGFARGFKMQVPDVNLDEFIKTMSEGIERRLREALQVAVRAQRVAMGQTKVSEAMQANEVALLFVAPDSSTGAQKKFSSNADRKGVAVVNTLDGSTLGRLVGRDFVSVLAINDAELSARINTDIEALAELSVDQG